MYLEYEMSLLPLCMDYVSILIDPTPIVPIHLLRS